MLEEQLSWAVLAWPARIPGFDPLTEDTGCGTTCLYHTNWEVEAGGPYIQGYLVLYKESESAWAT